MKFFAWYPVFIWKDVDRKIEQLYLVWWEYVDKDADFASFKEVVGIKQPP